MKETPSTPGEKGTQALSYISTKNESSFVVGSLSRNII